MKKVIYIVAALFLTVTTMQAQDRPMPKPGPAPKVNVGKPQTFSLPNGLKVMVVENHKLPRVSYNLTLDTPPYAEGDKKGVSDMTSALMGNGTKTISKDKFNEEVDFLGANINFSGSGASASGLSKYGDRILELMADGALNPLFTQAEFDKQKAQILEGLKADEKSVPAAAERVADVLVYGKNHPNGEYLSEATLNNVTLKDVQNNYSTYFVPGKAYLVIVGDVKFANVKSKVEKLFGSWKAAMPPMVKYTDPKDLPASQINFVDMGNAVQSEISVINVVNLKMTDKEYFAALLANQILGGGGEGRLFLNLREAHGWTYGAYSSLGSGKYVTTFNSSTSVRNTVTDSAVVEIFNEIKRMRNDLVSEEDLKNAKAKYIGNFVMQVEKPATIARYALMTQTQNLPENFYENYIANINAVTAQDIKNAANKFFLAENARVVVVGKASDVLPGLEKRGIPIAYFDKYGNPAEKPGASKAVATGVTVKSVVDNYIKAIGGEAAVKAVKTLAITYTGTVQGMQMQMDVKMADKKQALVVTAMGQQMMKQVINEKAGYMVMQGQRQEITGEDLADYQKDAMPFDELNLPSKPGVALKGIEKFNGVDAYVITEGDNTYYFDVKSGLKIAKSEKVEGPQGPMNVLTPYSDYRAVKGVKVPYKTAINVGIEIELTAIDAKVNEGVTDADFQ
jgi:zinc protease